MCIKERNKRGQILFTKLLQNYCPSFDQLPLEEQTSVKSILNTKQEDIMDTWLQIQDDSLRLFECLGFEDEKQELYEVSYITTGKKTPHFLLTFFFTWS